jgi:hypothetical protein
MYDLSVNAPLFFLVLGITVAAILACCFFGGKGK